jgi:ATP-dependent Clp protease ATP-binding subunit ClpB
VADSALSEIATAGFDPVYGARPLKRAIQSQLEDPLAKAILEGPFRCRRYHPRRLRGRHHAFRQA